MKQSNLHPVFGKILDAHAPKTGHTPGPWAHKQEVDKSYDSRTGEPRTKTNHWVRGQGEHDYVALITGNSKNPAADARLIAAAPELLEALEVLLENIDAYGDHLHDKLEGVQAAREALAKATGGAE